MREVVIIDGVRTPIAKSGKSSYFANIRGDELGAISMKAIVERNGIDPNIIEDVIWGVTTAADEMGYDVGRTSNILAGFPLSIPGVQLNRFCSSGLQAIQFAVSSIASGYGDCMIAGGAEHMTRTPAAKFIKNFHPDMGEFMDMNAFNMGWTAEFIAREGKITREEQDEWAANSHWKAAKATKEGLFKREIIPVEADVPQKDGNTERMLIETDQGVRGNITMETLASLPTVFAADDLATVTAGNASQTNDASSAVLVMSMDKAKELGLKPRLKMLSFKVVAMDPRYTMDGPIYAIPEALKRAGLTRDDIGVWEVNEAFASQSVRCQKILGYPKERLNMRGGGISLGHPLACSGARMTATLMNIMDDMDAKYGVVAMCAAVGQGAAAVFERIK